MKITGLVQIDKGIIESVTAEAFGKQTANVYVNTENPQDAPELLRAGIEKALAECGAWAQEDPVNKDEGPVYDEPLPEDEIERRSIEWEMEQFEDTAQGERFLKSIDNAETFTETHDKSGGLLLDQLRYLANISQLNIWEGLATMYNIAYRRGYNSAKNTEK